MSARRPGSGIWKRVGTARHGKPLGQQRLADAGCSLKRYEGSWRWSRLVEPFGIFALIMAEIWWPRSYFTASWLVILGLILLSHVLHREEAVGLGFRVSNFDECVDELCPPLLFVVPVVLSAGVLLQTTRNISFEQGLMSLGVYYPWGLLQQYVLNCHFANRLQALHA